MAVYVVSDIHGELELFLAGLDLIRFSDRDELYVIGDAIDRGDSGIEVLQYIMEHENMDLLIGNHEFLMLNSVNLQGLRSCNGSDSLLWRYGNGGDVTWKKYAMLNDEERIKLLNWLRKRFVIKVLPVKGTDYCLTHSHYKKSCENKRYHELTYGEVFSITWTSMYREDTETHNPFNVYESYDYTFITGHVPVQMVTGLNELKALKNENMIDIDGGCSCGHEQGINNGLIFLRLDDMQEFPVAWASLE